MEWNIKWQQCRLRNGIEAVSRLWNGMEWRQYKLLNGIEIHIWEHLVRTSSIATKL